MSGAFFSYIKIFLCQKKQTTTTTKIQITKSISGGFILFIPD